VQLEDIETRIADALRVERYTTAACLAADIEDVVLRESWFEHIAQKAQETYERHYHSDTTDDQWNWYVDYDVLRIKEEEVTHERSVVPQL
jgi:hypothetical protein